MTNTAAPRPWEDCSLAANGQSIKNNFDSWMAGSVARNPNGTAVVVFRGDAKPFDDFDGRREPGIFFSVEPERATYYGPVREYCLRVQNPIDLRDPYALWRAGDVGKEIIETLFKDYHDSEANRESGEPLSLMDMITAIETGSLWQLGGDAGFRMESWRALQSLCAENGFDSMIVPDAGEGCGTGIDWVIFDSNNAKCISEHAGLFKADSNSLTDFEVKPRDQMRL